MIKDTIEFSKAAFGAFSPHRNPFYLLIVAGCAALIISCLELPTHASCVAMFFLAFFAVSALIAATRRPANAEPEPAAHGRILCAFVAIVVFAIYDQGVYELLEEQTRYMNSAWSVGAFYAALAFSAMQFVPFLIRPTLIRFHLTDVNLSVTACLLAIGAEIWIALAHRDYKQNDNFLFLIPVVCISLSAWGSLLIFTAAIFRPRATNSDSTDNVSP